jgi:dolichyl-phosphate-mannose-protein mannosyltransferase
VKGKGKRSGPAPAPIQAADHGRVLQGAEWGIAILLTGIALFYHFTFFTHAGGLWRDEINSVAFARMPSMAITYDSLRYDSFPLLSTVALRGWVATVGATDTGLRIFGLLVGVLLLGALWLTCRLLGETVPLVSLALVGTNPWIVRSVDSIRPYGLGIVLIVATFGCLWKAVETSRPKWFVTTGIAALLSVQCMYQNAFLLLAICIAGVLVSLRDARTKTALGVVGIGLIAALSLVIYLPSFTASQSWGILIRGFVEGRRLWNMFLLTIGLGSLAKAWPWLALAILTVSMGLAALLSRRKQRAARTRSQLAFFCATALVVGTAAYFMALKSTQLQTQPWYYVPLVVLIASILDAAAGLLAATERRRIARLAVSLAAALTIAIPGWKEVQTRWTNVDVVAAGIAKQVTAGDVIVLNPFWIGMTFQRYYQGQTPWVTVPPLEDVHIVRYDLVKVAMTRPTSVNPVLEKMAEALRSGHRVWWVGGFPAGADNEKPQILPPPPLPGTGWYLNPYLFSWGRQAAHLLESHGLESSPVEFPVNGPVSVYENVTVTVVSGWH